MKMNKYGISQHYINNINTISFVRDKLKKYEINIDDGEFYPLSCDDVMDFYKKNTLPENKKKKKLSEILENKNDILMGIVLRLDGNKLLISKNDVEGLYVKKINKDKLIWYNASYACSYMLGQTLCY